MPLCKHYDKKRKIESKNRRKDQKTKRGLHSDVVKLCTAMLRPGVAMTPPNHLGTPTPTPPICDISIWEPPFGDIYWSYIWRMTNVAPSNAFKKQFWINKNITQLSLTCSL